MILIKPYQVCVLCVLSVAGVYGRSSTLSLCTRTPVTKWHMLLFVLKGKNCG